jgi:hypothetical protein
MEARLLFPQPAALRFSPLTDTCRCGVKLVVLKTTKKTVATLTIGQFKALETQQVYPHCDVIYRSEELRQLTPHRGQFGFDVIEYIGRALFVDCRNELAIQADLAVKNIPISVSEIAFLGKRFILYLALAHKQSSEALKDYMSSKGGYIYIWMAPAKVIVRTYSVVLMRSVTLYWVTEKCPQKTANILSPY